MMAPRVRRATMFCVKHLARHPGNQIAEHGIVAIEFGAHTSPCPERIQEHHGGEEDGEQPPKDSVSVPMRALRLR